MKTGKTDLTEERFLVTVAYDGSDYMGWQIQNNAHTVEGEIRARLSRIFKKPVVIHGSGRTDAGVHSVGQTFHFDAFWRHSPKKLKDALNTGEQAGILITKIQRVHSKFHARYSSKGKRYRYEINVGYSLPWKARYSLGRDWDKLDVKAMRRAAKLLMGKHDFRAFGATHSQGMETERPVKDLRCLSIISKGKRITVITEADGYLYKMVRRLVGGLLRVGEGKMTPERLLAYREEKTITSEVPTAPARGLFMDKVFYDPKSLKK
jgi:tRNA pseudouridine38-40 synthase